LRPTISDLGEGSCEEETKKTAEKGSRDASRQSLQLTIVRVSTGLCGIICYSREMLGGPATNASAVAPAGNQGSVRGRLGSCLTGKGEPCAANRLEKLYPRRAITFLSGRERINRLRGCPLLLYPSSKVSKETPGSKKEGRPFQRGVSGGVVISVLGGSLRKDARRLNRDV